MGLSASPLPSIHPVLDPLIVSLADAGDPASEGKANLRLKTDPAIARGLKFLSR